MEVQCPQCQSRFHLPDAVVRPNVKLRCSVCQHVFVYDGPPSADPSPAVAPSSGNNAPKPAAVDVSAEGGADLNLDSPEKGSKKEKKSGGKGKIILSILVLLLCIGGGAGVWWYMFKSPQEAAKSTSSEASESVKNLTLRGMRQYYAKNEKIGNIFVVEGKVVNGYAVPKELIEVEAAIYAANKEVLMSKKQLAGTVLSRFQLEVLGEDELESFLHNEIEILTKNTNIPPGGEVPFMVLFYDPPPEVTEFGVKVFSSKDVKK